MLRIRPDGCGRSLLALHVRACRATSSWNAVTHRCFGVASPSSFYRVPCLREPLSAVVAPLRYHRLAYASLYSPFLTTSLSSASTRGAARRFHRCWTAFRPPPLSLHFFWVVVWAAWREERVRSTEDVVGADTQRRTPSSSSRASLSFLTWGETARTVRRAACRRAAVQWRWPHKSAALAL